MNFDQWLEQQEARLPFLGNDELDEEYRATDSDRYAQAIIRETFRREVRHMALDVLLARTAEPTPFGKYCASVLEDAWDAWKDEQG
jgi:hypothetical protein